MYGALLEQLNLRRNRHPLWPMIRKTDSGSWGGCFAGTSSAGNFGTTAIGANVGTYKHFSETYFCAYANFFSVPMLVGTNIFAPTCLLG